MPNENTRSYEVLAHQRALESNGETSLGGVAFDHLGVVTAADADGAIRAIIQRHGLPSQASGRVVAVPTGNWNEREIEIEQVPTVHIRPLEGAQTSLTPDESSDG
jgi:hypothetical protein